MTAVPPSAEPQCPSPVKPPSVTQGDAGRRPPCPAPNRRRVWLIVLAVIAGLAFCWLFATAIWRMYGPQFVMLPDGWVRVVDRDFGFETELPGWYSKRPSSFGGSGVYYQSRFASSSWSNFDIQVTNWKPTTQSASAELLAILENERSQGKVKVLNDRSADPATPSIEYETTQGSSVGGAWTIRRRVAIHEGRLLELRIIGTDGIPPADVTRAFDSFRWTR